MTNEAQTNIVVAQAKKMLPMMKSTLGESIERYAEFYKQSLLNMAEWKDKQYADIIKEESNTSYESGLAEGTRKAEARFKEYLEQNMTNYPDYMNGTDAYAFGMKEGYVAAFNKIINELFEEDRV